MEPWHMLGWLCAEPFLLVLSADVEIKIRIFGDVVLKQPRLLRIPELLRRGARRAVVCLCCVIVYCAATCGTALQRVVLGRRSDGARRLRRAITAALRAAYERGLIS